MRSFILLATSVLSVLAADEKVETVTTATPVPPRPFVWTDFITEIVVIGFLALYVLIWWQGSRSNLSQATKWTNANVRYFEEQFSLVGNKANNNKVTLVKDGPADYLLYTSGRRNVQFGHWWLKLKPRNDPVTHLLTFLFSLVQWVKPVKDRVNVTLTLDKDIINHKFVFAILDKSIAKETHEKRFDLFKMTKIATANLPSHLVIYAESQKLAELLLNGKTGEILRQSSGLESLVITYLPEYEPERLNSDKELKISLVYDLKNTNSSPLVELPCAFADTIGSLNLPGDVTSKLNKNKAELQKIFAKREAEDRAEELAKKKAEEKRAQEERIKNLSPAEQRKYDEKERNREKKRELKKRTKRA
ncbi:uncharacterized protein BX664DRAFT_275715 [Halteromyces radiatus]|uniref:uncharacterized protein n=1 Tax=Halteromyces radiatus TaxID=101107 RepID=UPI002220EC9A|nr:uncharacterized protein BX664DRAFT_275715 [Halteromyces radiatus]KAI8097171.1 hypothetical protein BX664DRAFT_275715 [Halteromyces radiatus]